MKVGLIQVLPPYSEASSVTTQTAKGRLLTWYLMTVGNRIKRSPPERIGATGLRYDGSFYGQTSR